MKFSVTLDGTFRKAMEEERTRMGRAATKAMAEVATGAKDELRKQIKSGFKPTPRRAKKMGQDFQKSVQSPVYPDPGRGKTPKKASLAPATLPHVKAEFASAFEDGGTVSARDGFLVVPLPAVQREKTAYDRQQVKSSYRKWSDVRAAQRDMGPLRLLKSRSGFVLAADAEKAAARGIKNRRRNKDFVPLFAVVRTVRAPKKLSFRATVRRWADKLPAAFDKHLATTE